MFRLFRRSHISIVFAFLTFSSLSSLAASECCPSYGCNRLYIGAFGGELFSNSPDIRQTGTVYIFDDLGIPLAVDARGNSNRTSAGFGGVQLGYVLTQSSFCIGRSNWVLTPAVEAEAFFYRESRNGELINNNNNVPTLFVAHEFLDSFKMNAGVYVANAVFTLNSCCLGRFAPYVGIGIGAAHLSAKKGESLQISSPEPGINHFNSKRNASDWTLAVQVKTGIQYSFCNYLRLFVEYRFVSIDPSRFTFGSTVYPVLEHPPTSPWVVDLGHILYNGFALGIQFDL